MAGAIIALLSMGSGQAVAADRAELSGPARLHPEPARRSPLHSDRKIKTCRAHARERGYSDRMEPDAQDQQAAPVFLDAVMYFQPGLRAHDVRGDDAGKPSSYRDRRGTRQPGVIDICRDPSRYY